MSSLESESAFTNALLDETIENYINYLFLNNSKIHFLFLQTKLATSWMFYVCLLCCLFLIAIIFEVFSNFGLNQKGKICTTHAL